MSERATPRPTTAERSRQRHRGPRSARKRAAAGTPIQSAEMGAATAPALVASAPTPRTRRGPSLAFKPIGLSREQEFAYIRSDMRRLFIVAAGLLALMVVILFVVER